VQDREALYEEPHITIWRKAVRYRFSLRRRVFLDPKPDPSAIPQSLLTHIYIHWEDLCDAWNARFPANPVDDADEEKK
jgi:hypothetical protein